ncbi:Uncharacterised protein [Legionella pneumophila]|nr:Uncharacterised protein [Legionella pneumophila]CZH30379.1 Uncharacterised protein [Legionella pneumophila]
MKPIKNSNEHVAPEDQDPRLRVTQSVNQIFN